jgi:aerobic-type carbon monoxide dehydrogenase small subunit (CoxS/CutS family)
MASLNLIVNGSARTVDVDPRMPLLWVLRDVLNLTGTKYGCGIAQCGACTVQVDGVAVRSCGTAAGSVAGRRITTIEGLSVDRRHPLQQAWMTEQVPQCGYCQSGMLMAAATLFTQNPKPSDADIDAALGGHICRCGTYQRIRQAIHRAADAEAAVDTKSASRDAGGER